MIRSQIPNHQSQIARRKPSIADLRPQAPNLLFAMVFVIACLVRFWKVTQIPHNLWVDEAWFALRARDILRGINYIPLARPALGVGDSPMFVYLAAAFQMLGLPAAYSPRFAAATAGALTIGLLYPALTSLWEVTAHLFLSWVALQAGRLASARIFRLKPDVPEPGLSIG